jgi:hypothetical protein
MTVPLIPAAELVDREEQTDEDEVVDEDETQPDCSGKEI